MGKNIAQIEPDFAIIRVADKRRDVGSAPGSQYYLFSGVHCRTASWNYFVEDLLLIRRAQAANPCQDSLTRAQRVNALMGAVTFVAGLDGAGATRAPHAPDAGDTGRKVADCIHNSAVPAHIEDGVEGKRRPESHKNTPVGRLGSRGNVTRRNMQTASRL
jgi:hypothetical protein